MPNCLDAEKARITTAECCQIFLVFFFPRSIDSAIVLDLASARRGLWKFGSSVPYSTATVTDIAEFDFRLMQVVELFFSLGTWRSMWRRLTLNVYDGRLTIPRGFDTCRQVASGCGCPIPIYSQFHRFAGFGVSVVDSTLQFEPRLSGWVAGLRLLDENAQTFRIPTGTFTLRAVATEVSADGLTLIGGFDADGNELFGEITLALINGAANTTQQYTQLPEIQKAVTTNAVLLYAVDTTTAVATLIASYAPGETIPSYRQYDAAGFCSSTTDAPVVSAICKLGFMTAVTSNDIIIPGNINALALGLQSIGFRDKVDPVNAGIYMGPNSPAKTGKMAGAIDILDAELEELQASEQTVLQVSENFACGNIPNVR